MTAVQLTCGHEAECAHSMGERLVPCPVCGVEHVVAAIHTNAVVYETRRRHPEPEVVEAAVEATPDGGYAIVLPPSTRLVDCDPIEQRS